MSFFRSFKRTVYGLTALASVTAALFCGAVAENSDISTDVPFKGELYREPYAHRIFDYNAPTSGAEAFGDVSEEDWFFNYVDVLVKKGIMNGRSTTEYSPSGTLTLPECCAVMVRSLGLDDRAFLEREEVYRKGLLGHDKWYIGYVKLCVDAKIVPEGDYGFGYDENGNFIMTSDYYESVPIKRCELADFIYGMTVLERGSVTARGKYSEREPYGHGFIRSGLYDRDAMARYADVITDFNEIPEKYREGVLACFYNGIFNGDTEGRFNPNGSITRAEIAKVACVLNDISARFGEDLRENPFVVSEEMLRNDSFDGKELRGEFGYAILEESARLASLEGDRVKVGLRANAPLGYTVEAHVYQENGEEKQKLCEIGTMTREILFDKDGTEVLVSDGSIIEILYVLRNIARGGEVEGVLELTLENGVFTYGDGISRL